MPAALKPTLDFNQVAAQQTLLLAVPIQTLRQLLGYHARLFKGKILVACCKGIEQSSNLGPLAILQDIVPNCQSALLTGPSFAHDIACGLPAPTI